MNKKYTLVEFVAALENINKDEDGYDFDNIDPSWLEHWKKNLPLMLKDGANDVHFGDCTSAPITCDLCSLEGILRDYYKYYFHEEQFRKEDLI